MNLLLFSLNRHNFNCGKLKMDFSTISNKTTFTEVEELTNGELNERYYLLKKQYESLSITFETTKQELHETRRSYNTALDVQRHLTVELEAHQAEDERKRSDLNSRITSLQEEISLLRQDRSETTERHAAEINKLQTQIRDLKDEISTKVTRDSPERDNGEVDELRTKTSAAVTEANMAKAALEQTRVELATWQMRAEQLNSDLEQVKEASEIRKEELKAANEREAVALADLAEVKAMLHQCTDSPDLQPHAAKGNSLFAEVEDKRQEMAKTLIQMKQTNSKLRRDLANKQAELETLLHEKQTIWEQQLGASAHYDRELIESYEERISQLEGVCEQQRREAARAAARLSEAAPARWLPALTDTLRAEIQKLRAEVLSRGAAQLASAAQVRELRRKLASVTSTKPSVNQSPTEKADVTKTNVSVEIVQKPQMKKINVDDVRKKVTFN